MIMKKAKIVNNERLIELNYDILVYVGDCICEVNFVYLTKFRVSNIVGIIPKERSISLTFMWLRSLVL